MARCSIKPCKGTAVARSWCHKHWSRWRKHGDPRAKVQSRDYHGLSHTAEYKIWFFMKLRCTDPDREAYKHYGGRGIRVCKRWRKFENFLKDMGPRPSKLHTLDRKNNDGDYRRKNCRWATRAEQAANRRTINDTTTAVTVGRETRSISDWARKVGVVSRWTISYRLRHNWSPRDAIYTPAGGAA